jgi:hypothetical protein
MFERQILSRAAAARRSREGGSAIDRQKETPVHGTGVSRLSTHRVSD